MLGQASRQCHPISRPLPWALAYVACAIACSAGIRGGKRIISSSTLIANSSAFRDGSSEFTVAEGPSPGDMKPHLAKHLEIIRRWRKFQAFISHVIASAMLMSEMGCNQSKFHTMHDVKMKIVPVR